MNKNVIDCIPSKAMRKYLSFNPVEMSILQEATIISEYAGNKNKIPLFQNLLERTNNESEKMLLSSAITDLQSSITYWSEKTLQIYSTKFPHYNAYPFMEVCNLPILFKKGDIIRAHGNIFYYVRSDPGKIINSDFSDECYLCYSLMFQKVYKVKNYYDLGYIHEHINLCEADKASIRELNNQQRDIYRLIQKILEPVRRRRLQKFRV